MGRRTLISYPTITLCETCQGGYMPLVMASRAVPCGPLHLDDQDPNTVDALGSTGGFGAHHVGSAVRLTGRITAVSLDPRFFYISDGGTTWNGNPLVTDETSAVGIRVEMPGGFPYWPAVVGDYATITGISALRRPDSSYYPVLLLAATQADRVSHCGRLLTIDPIVFDECTPPQGEANIRIRYTVCDMPATDVRVSVTLDAGEIFDPLLETWIEFFGTSTTNSEGYATFRMRSLRPITTPDDTLRASAADWGGGASADRNFTHERVPLCVLLVPGLARVGVAVPVEVRLADSTGIGWADKQVTLHTTNGYFNGGGATWTGRTEENGAVTVTYTPMTCPGVAAITVSGDEPCPFEVSQRVRVLCEGVPARFVFCVDSTHSMPADIGSRLVPLVTAIEQRVDSAEVAAIAFRDTLDSQFGPSTNTAGLKTWLLATQAEAGGDSPENALDALAAATTIFSNCDIVLATDSTYHERGDGTNITNWIGPEVAALLEAAGCRVFIDFTTYQYGSWYEPLAVNGALEEDLGSFTFPLFTAHALP